MRGLRILKKWWCKMGWGWGYKVKETKMGVKGQIDLISDLKKNEKKKIVSVNRLFFKRFEAFFFFFFFSVTKGTVGSYSNANPNPGILNKNKKA